MHLILFSVVSICSALTGVGIKVIHFYLKIIWYRSNSVIYRLLTGLLILSPKPKHVLVNVALNKADPAIPDVSQAHLFIAGPATMRTPRSQTTLLHPSFHYIESKDINTQVYSAEIIQDKCYIMASWTSKSVKELQSFLRNRGVAFSSYLKAGLVELCEVAEELGIDIDPDGLVEDREEIIIPPATKFILDSACLSVRLSVCLSVNFFVSAL